MEYKTLEEREEYLTAYLTGVIFGDGCISKRSNTYRIDIYNSDEDYIGILISILTYIFPKNNIGILSKKSKIATMYNYCLTISNKEFHNKIYPFKSFYRYTIPTWMTTKNEKAGFISGLFDTDGCVWKKTIPINLTTKYRTSLVAIKETLYDDFGISSNICSYTGISRLNIKSYENLVKFEKQIGFLHPRKKKLLDNLLENHYIERKIKLKKEQEIKKLYNKGIGVTQISKITNTPQTTTICWLDEYFPKRNRKKEHSKEDYYKAIKLFETHSVNKISKLLSIPKPTIGDWLYKKQIPNSVRRKAKDGY